MTGPASENHATSPEADDPRAPAGQQILHLLEYAALRLVMGLLGLMPLRTATCIAATLMRLLLMRTGRHRRALAALAAAFPEKSAAEHEAIAAHMWENVGRVIAEVAHIEDLQAAPHRFEKLDPHRRVRAYIAQRYPVICVSLHTGNWELLGLPVAAQGHAPAAAYRRLANPWVEAYLVKLRSRLLPGGLFPVGSLAERRSKLAMDALRRMVQYVRKDGFLGIITDYRDVNGLPVRFLGQTVMWPTAPAILARNLGIPITLSRCIRVGEDSRFVMEVRRLPYTYTSNREKDIRAVTAGIATQFEAWIREFPEQWLWSRAPFMLDRDIAKRIARAQETEGDT